MVDVKQGWLKCEIFTFPEPNFGSLERNRVGGAAFQTRCPIEMVNLRLFALGPTMSFPPQEEKREEGASSPTGSSWLAEITQMH